MPVLPAVDSTTKPPALSSPRLSASRIIWRPARSLTEPPGFMNSALPRIVQPVAAEARCNLISGVWPIASTMPSRICMPDALSRRGFEPSGGQMEPQDGPWTGAAVRLWDAPVNCRRYWKAPRNHIGALADGIPAHSRLLTGPKSNSSASGTARKNSVPAQFGRIEPMKLDVNTLFMVTIYVEAILGLLLLFAWAQNTQIQAVVLVGLCPSDPRGLGRAVRHVRHGARHRSPSTRQRAAVYRLRGHLDRRARVRRPPGRAGLSGHRRRALAAGLPPAGAGRSGRRCAR